MTDRANRADHESMMYVASVLSIALGLITVGIIVQELKLLDIIIFAKSKTHGGRFSKLPG